MSRATSASRVRYLILGMLCLLAMITYLDRAVYGSVKVPLMLSVGEPNADRFYILLVAFQLAYALFEVPTGWMGDRFGPRSTLLRIVIWWSVFVSITAFAGIPLFGSGVMIGFGALVTLQFFFGMGEAGAFPNMTRALYNWFPPTARGFGQGTIWLSARFMGGMTPLIWVVVTEVIGLEWRQALWACAGLAVFWCILFWSFFTNHPAEHSWVNAEERALIDEGRRPAASHHGVPWGRLYSNPNLWFLCLMYTVTNFNWYFLMYFLPGALKGQFLDLNSTLNGRLVIALMSGFPLLLGMAGCMIGGLLTDRHIRRTGDRKWGRRIYAMFGYGMAGVCYLLATGFTNNFWPFITCIILVGFFNDLMMSSAWAAAQDIGRQYAAIVSGTMNMIGNLGAALGNFVTGTILASYGNSTEGIVICFYLYAAMYAAGVLLWLGIDASKPLIAEDGTEEAEPIVIE